MTIDHSRDQQAQQDQQFHKSPLFITTPQPINVRGFANCCPCWPCWSQRATVRQVRFSTVARVPYEPAADKRTYPCQGNGVDRQGGGGSESWRHGPGDRSPRDFFMGQESHG
jgi:hypothetical protein